MQQLRKKRGVLRLAVSFTAVLLLAACGQKGDLYLPEASQLLNIIVL